MAKRQRKFKVETLCRGCGAEYLSKAKPKRTPPKRCKECKSSQTVVNPSRERKYYVV